jgi:ubiquinone/menaquinone biosynthesis C-methylase UbiE
VRSSAGSGDERDGRPIYALGHSGRELNRLSVQARLVDPITRRFFLDGGIGEGMRVLDVGSGVGDVAFLVAELVGAAGEVVGTDRSGSALAVARERAATLAIGNVMFQEGDPAEMVFEQPFDAIVGRYVLMFQPDPVAMLRKLAVHARAGGVVAFHEPYRGGIRSFPPVPSYDRGWELVDETFR